MGLTIRLFPLVGMVFFLASTKSREKTPKIQDENLVVEPYPSISSLDLDTPPKQVGFNLFSNNITNEEERDSNAEQPEDEVTFRFPILDLDPDVVMKNNPHSVLPQVHGMITEDPDSFLFEFEILCESYNYVNDGKKLKLFRATLKYFAL